MTHDNWGTGDVGGNLWLRDGHVSHDVAADGGALQKQTGSAYALNALIETDRLVVEGELIEDSPPTPSGKGQIVPRYAACHVAVFSN